MPNRSDKRSLTIIFSVFLFVIAGTYIVTLLARGYRPQINQNGVILEASGLLSVTSRPKGASVYLNDKLVTATDDTLNLTPNNYTLKIIKDGYLPWQKTFAVKKEVVYQTDAQLFRSSPELRPLTLTGAINPVISPDYSKIIYSVASASATSDNGLYVIELAIFPLSLSKNTPRQLAPNYPGLDWSKADFSFSPDSRQVLVTFKNTNAHYLLNLDSTITANSLTDVTYRLPQLQKEWQTKEQEIVHSRLDRLPLAIQPYVATESAKFISFSSNDDKVLYLAASSSALPSQIISPPPAQSTQVQSRQIIKDNYYVYDLKDDTNFLVGPRSEINNPFWLYNSSNLVYVNNQSIVATDHDSTNKLTLFQGQISTNHVFPWADGTKIIVLTPAYSGSTENLYAITIR